MALDFFTSLFAMGMRFMLVLGVMLMEIISRWFTDGEWPQFAILGGIILTLGFMRIVAVRYSPAPTTFTQQVNQPGPSFP